MALPARLPLFFAATLALTLTPGPAVLFIVARSVAQGRGAGLRSVLGIGLGNGVHAVATSLGLAAVIASSPALFAAVKWCGAGYLVFLGLRRLVAGGAGLAGTPPADADAGRAVLGQAFVVALLNPKTVLFFLAFLPQFADPARGAVTLQLLLLGGLFVAVAMVTDAGYVLLAGGMGAFLRRHPAFAIWEPRLSALVYVGLGVAAAFAGARAG
jgi:threonine/homoserine/homoserine lactone efflux protein